MSLNLEAAQTVLRSQPFSALLGTEIRTFAAEYVELVIPISNQLEQQNGFVHGGVVSYAADNALTFAGGAALGHAVITSEYKINFLQPARGESLVAKASLIHAGKNQAVCKCEVYAIHSGDAVLCAVAQGTIATLSSPK